MEKFLNLLSSKKLMKERKYIEKKLDITKNQEIISNLCSLFEPDPEKRLDIDLVLGVFESLQTSFIKLKCAKTKLNPKYPEIPDDVRMFCRAKDLFY